jgi:hypothetical protein
VSEVAMSIEQRVAHVEQQLSVACDEIVRLRRQVAVRTALGIVTIVAAAVGGHAIGIEAQGSQPLTVKAPFTVTDSVGRAIVRITEQGPRGITTFNQQGQAESPRGVQTVKAPFTVTDADNRPIATVGLFNDRRGIEVYNRQGNTVGQLQAIEDGTGGVIVRNGQKGAPGAGISYYDGENPTFGMKGADGRFFVKITKDSAALAGPFEVDDTLGKPIATIVESGDSRSIRVLSKSGGVAANMTATSALGGILGVRPGKTLPAAVAAGAADAGVYLYVNEKGYGSVVTRGPAGKSFTEINQEGFFAFGLSGSTVARLGAGKLGGILELDSQKGDVMVEAGVLEGGRGVVRAGPYTGGPIGNIGLPFAILGRK